MFHLRTWICFHLNIILTLMFILRSKSIPIQQNDNIELRTRASGNDLASCLDESVNPCTNFYGYTCGHWTGYHPPIEGFPIWSNWYIIANDIRPKIQRLLSEADSESDNEAIRKARKVYRACMNKDKIEEVGADPLTSIINENGGWPLIMKPKIWNAKNITWQQIHSKLMKTMGTEALFSMQIVTDPKNSSMNRLTIAQPDLVLKRKELITPGNYALAMAYNMYKVKVSDVLQRSSTSSSEELDYGAELVEMNNFESQLAEITQDEQSMKDVDQWYNLMTINELQNYYDSAGMDSSTAKIDWVETIRDVFTTLTPEIIIDGSEHIIVPGKIYFTKLAALLNKTSSETIVNYIMWRVITDASLYTNDELRNLLTNFNDKRVGADPIGSREYGCVSSSQMERAVSYAFVKRYFSSDSKQAALELVENIQEAMKENIRQSVWLDNETKHLATEKIDSIIKLIGYPDNYNAANIDDYYSEFTPTDSYFENEMRRRKLTIKNILRSLRKPTEKHKWPIEPDAVNAYYIPVLNTMLVPAGILQPPLFDLNRPSVINYGMIGATIGHEISHALDSNGRRFDKNGNAVTWWSQSTIDKYEEHAQCFIHQFNNYTIYDDGKQIIPVNGNLTLEENISDTTGLQVTWDAYKRFREKHGTSGAKIPGLERFTDDQIFFLAFGNLWCAYESDMYLQHYSPDDVHSPAKARVNGAVSNIKAFADAFHCPANSIVNPSKKCNIWK